MKKALFALLTLLLCFSLFACNPKDKEDSDDKKPSEDLTPGLSEPIETPIIDVPLG